MVLGSGFRRVGVTALSVALGLWALGAPTPGGFDAASAVRGDEPAPRESGRPSCVDVRAAPRLGAYGYDHWVEVHNRCDFAVRCEVATDVDPRPAQTLRLAPGARGEVLTRRESPARAYAPTVRCSVD
jgi:hypothetical protein